MSDRDTPRVPGGRRGRKGSQRVHTESSNSFVVPSKHSTRVRGLRDISSRAMTGGGWDGDGYAAMVSERKSEGNRCQEWTRTTVFIYCGLLQ